MVGLMRMIILLRHKATIIDMGIDSIKDVAKHADLLPLTGDGDWGRILRLNSKKGKRKTKNSKT